MDSSYKDSLELNQMKNSNVKTHVISSVFLFSWRTTTAEPLYLKPQFQLQRQTSPSFFRWKKPTLTSLSEVCVKYTVGEHGETRKNWCFPLLHLSSMNETPKDRNKEMPARRLEEEDEPLEEKGDENP